MKRGLPRLKGPGSDRVANTLHKLLIIMQVMPGQQHGTDDFLTAEYMVQIGAAIVAAGRTGARLVQRARIILMPGVFDVEHAATGKNLTRSRYQQPT